MSICVCLNTPIPFAEKSAKPGLVKPVTPRADFSNTNAVSFTSVNLGFRAETQRHVNLRYFGGPRLNPTFPYFSLRWTSYNFLGFSMLTHHFS